MAEEADDKMSEFEKLVDDGDIPKSSEEWLNTTQRLRFGLIKKHLKDTDDPKMLARIEGLAGGIDRQELTKMRMDQDKDEGQANREVAGEIFKRMVENGIMPSQAVPESVPIEDSGLEILDDELIQGDDTLNSVID